MKKAIQFAAWVAMVVIVVLEWLGISPPVAGVLVFISMNFVLIATYFEGKIRRAYRSCLNIAALLSTSAFFAFLGDLGILHF